jgi:ABC-2 type transport system permease protein
VRRELGGFFFSLTGYVIIAGVLLLLGVSFVALLESCNGGTVAGPLTEMFYSTMYFWLILLVATPVMTMRLFALEKFSGTFETLMTTPVRDLEVVLAKFLGALMFYVVTWLPLLACLHVVRRYTGPPAGFDWWPVGSTFLGILLLGCLYVAMGCFASALTRSQIIAAMVSLALGLSLFVLSFLRFSLNASAGWAAQALTYLSIIDHMEDFTRGVVDTRHVTFYLTFTVLFLFLTLKAVESRRWK